MKEGRKVWACASIVVVLATLLCSRAAKVTIKSATEFSKWVTGSNTDTDVELGGNIEFNGETNPYGTMNGGCTAFSGTFDGNNFTITSMTILSGHESVGLFCALGDGAVVKNVVFGEDCSISRNRYPEDSQYSGMVAGKASGKVRIQNVHNKGNVEAINISGGLIGFVVEGASLTIESCSNSGHIDGTEAAGGLIGKADAETTIVDCVNRGEVGTDATDSGGIVGLSTKMLAFTNCTNYGKITGSGVFAIDQYLAESGGILGQNQDAPVTFTNCVNFGEIETLKPDVDIYKNRINTHAAGIAGWIKNVTFINCTNYGYIHICQCENCGRASAGGLIAQAENYCSIINCNNFGTIEGNVAGGLGGIINAWSSDTIIYNVYNSMNAGNVTGNIVFGIVHRAAEATNVVSMGTLKSENNTPTSAFWDRSKVSSSSSLYYLSGIANSSNDGTEFIHSEKNFTTEDKRVVVDELNKEVAKNPDWMKWSNALVVSTMVKVDFGAPIGGPLEIGFNSTLASARLDVPYDQVRIFDETTHSELDKDKDIVLHEMLVMFYHTVDVTGDVEGSWLVAHGKTMSIVHELDKLLKNKSLKCSATVKTDNGTKPFDVRGAVEGNVTLNVVRVDQHSSSASDTEESTSSSETSSKSEHSSSESQLSGSEPLVQVVVVIDERVAGDSKTQQTVRGELMALDNSLDIKEMEVALNSNGMVSLVFVDVCGVAVANRTVGNIKEQRESNKCSVAESKDVLCHAVAASVTDEFGLSWKRSGAVPRCVALRVLIVCVLLWLVRVW